MLDVLHQNTVTDLRPKVGTDGQVRIKWPTGPDGQPFELAKVESGG